MPRAPLESGQGGTQLENVDALLVELPFHGRKDQSAGAQRAAIHRVATMSLRWPSHLTRGGQKGMPRGGPELFWDEPMIAPAIVWDPPPATAHAPPPQGAQPARDDVLRKVPQGAGVVAELLQ